MKLVAAALKCPVSQNIIAVLTLKVGEDDCPDRIGCSSDGQDSVLQSPGQNHALRGRPLEQPAGLSGHGRGPRRGSFAVGG